MSHDHEQLLDKYLRNECEDAELAEIKRLLREDSSFGKAFVGYTLDTAQLIDAAGEIVSDSKTTPPVKRFDGRLVLLALAACAVLAFFVLQRFDAYESRAVATVTHEVAAIWRDAPPTRTDGSLRPRQGVSLASGFAEFAFADGAKLILEGPAELVVVDEQRAKLLSGRAVARLDGDADNFVLETPAGEVVDRGTEFGVVVGANRETEVHVLDGAVDFSAPKAEAVRLSKSQAVAVSTTTTKELVAMPDAFMRTLPPEANPTPDYVHWSFDTIDGGELPDEGTGIAGKKWAARTRGVARSQGPEIVDGMIGKGLYFDGKGAFLETDFAGVGKGDSRTVAFWVKVPDQAKLDEAYAMLGWGSFKYKGATWQISWNCVKKDGPLGRLRAGVHGGQVIGTTDLRDGRWHHVAIVLFGGENPDVATHVMLYVDGELEPTSRKAVRAIQTDLTEGAKSVHIGKNASSDKTKPFFRGWIDDVVISNEPLSTVQIRRIMKEGGGALKAPGGAL
jgi:hypothetical protein